MTRLLVPIPEARERLGGIGHTTIYALFNNGDLTKVNLGRRSFVTEESLAALVDRLTAEATTPRTMPTSGRQAAVQARIAELATDSPVSA